MADNVEYTLTLNDMLTGKLKAAEREASVLEGTIGGIQKALGILGLAGGAFLGFEFLKSSVNDFNESAQASAQLDATLRSTANAANLNRDALDAQATALMKNSLYDDDAITGAQAMLGTFTQIKDKVFMDAIPAIVDLSTKMGGDLKGATIQVGKALNDPLTGLAALRKSGVSFSESQLTVIDNLVKTGKIAEAQKIIIKELGTEFKGSAEAAAKAGTGPFIVLGHELQNVKEDLGALLVEWGTKLVPIMMDSVDLFSNVVKGLKGITQDGTPASSTIRGLRIAFISLASAVGTYFVLSRGLAAWELITLGVLKARILYTELLTGFELARAEGMGVLTAAQWALNAAMDANPIGALVVALVAIGVAIYEAYKNVGWFHAGIWAIGAVLKEFAKIAMDVFTGVGHVIHGVLTGLNQSEIESGFKTAADAVFNSGKRIGNAFKTGYSEGMADFNAGIKAGEVAKKPTDAKKPVKPTDPTADLSTKKASGTKSITINISINKLIETFKIETTNLTDGASKIREHVANTILQAVNDSSITAGVS